MIFIYKINNPEDILTQQHDRVDDGEGEHITSDHLDNHSNKRTYTK